MESGRFKKKNQIDNYSSSITLKSISLKKIKKDLKSNFIVKCNKNDLSQ